MAGEVRGTIPCSASRPGRAGIGVLRIVTFLMMALALLIPVSSATAADEGWSNDAPSVVYTVATSADGGITVAGRRDNTVIAYNRDGSVRWTATTGGTVYGVAISDDGGRIAVASEDRNVYLFDGDGNQLWAYRGKQTFLSVSITGDGKIVAAGSEDRTVSILDASGSILWQKPIGDHVTQVALYGSARGFRVVAGGRDSRVSLFDGNGTQIWQALVNYSVRSLDVNANGATIVVGDGQETLYLLDGGSGDIRWQHPLGSAVSGVGVSRDGTTVVAATADGRLAVFSSDGDRTHDATTSLTIEGLSLDAGADTVAIAADDRVGLYSRSADGAFTLPGPKSKATLYALVLAGAAIVVLLVLAVWGMRRRPDGERVWRDTVRNRRTIGRSVWRARTSYLFLVPTVVLLLLFSYYPAISGIYHAFTEWSPGAETRWVGLKQFRALGDNRYFWAGIGNLVIFIVTGFLKLLVPLAVAEMIFHLRSHRLGYAFRTLFVMQVIVPGVVGILLWVNVYDPNIGLANQILNTLGLGDFTRYWLGDAKTAIWSIVFMGFPWVSAFALLIFYGGLIAIPMEILDSAALDGASTWQRIVNIDLPLLLGQIRLLVILTFIATVQEFAAVFLTTGGGPGSSTYVPSLELYYQAVRFNNFGGAAAIGAVLFIVILGGTILNLRYVKSSVEYES